MAGKGGLPLDKGCCKKQIFIYTRRVHKRCIKDLK